MRGHRPDAVGAGWRRIGVEESQQAAEGELQRIAGVLTVVVQVLGRLVDGQLRFRAGRHLDQRVEGLAGLDTLRGDGGLELHLVTVLRDLHLRPTQHAHRVGLGSRVHVAQQDGVALVGTHRVCCRIGLAVEHPVSGCEVAHVEGVRAGVQGRIDLADDQHGVIVVRCGRKARLCAVCRAVAGQDDQCPGQPHGDLTGPVRGVPGLVQERAGPPGRERVGARGATGDSGGVILGCSRERTRGLARQREGHALARDLVVQSDADLVALAYDQDRSGRGRRAPYAGRREAPDRDGGAEQ